MSTTVKLMSAIAKSVDIKDCEFKKIKNEVLFFFLNGNEKCGKVNVIVRIMVKLKSCC